MEPVEMLKLTLIVFGIFITLTIITKIAGVRSFGKLSSIDFISIISIASVSISLLSSSKYTLVEGFIMLVTITLFQCLFVFLLSKSKVFQHYFANKTKIVMWNGKILEERLRKSNISKSDFMLKLKKANIYEFHEIKAVILENTGDISVVYKREHKEMHQQVFSDVSV
ncbi:DUF421 domain-containing protein [Kordia jejudonensis]|uniref:DUF421 domain-containing protein n=1 Tax=Kordia jejudonensis TaxID=1348245 RepID=UPI000629420C|nr:YetF domain-containing protein [Kordia jejudonensis]